MYGENANFYVKPGDDYIFEAKPTLTHEPELKTTCSLVILDMYASTNLHNIIHIHDSDTWDRKNIFYIIFLIFKLNNERFHIIMSVSGNIVVDMNNVMYMGARGTTFNPPPTLMACVDKTNKNLKHSLDDICPRSSFKWCLHKLIHKKGGNSIYCLVAFKWFFANVLTLRDPKTNPTWLNWNKLTLNMSRVWFTRILLSTMDEFTKTSRTPSHDTHQWYQFGSSINHSIYPLDAKVTFTKLVWFAFKRSQHLLCVVFDEHVGIEVCPYMAL